MGNFFRTPLGVTIVGVVACAAAAALIYFLMISPQVTALAGQTSIYNENSQYLGTIPKEDAEKKVAAAKAQVAVAEATWDTIQRTKNPVIDMSNIMLAWRQLTNELVFNLGPDLEHQLRSTPGVTPLTPTVTLGGPPNDPNAVLQYSEYIPIKVGAGSGGAPGGMGGGGFGGGGFGGAGMGRGPMGAMGPPMMGGGMGARGFGGGGGGFGGGGGGFGGGGGGFGGGQGAIKMMGTFPAILHNVADWNKFNRIALVEGLSLSGNSPNLIGTYNVTIFEFPINTDKKGTPVKSGSGGGAGGAAGGRGPAGFAGGGPMGMAGPPGMGGGPPMAGKGAP